MNNELMWQIRGKVLGLILVALFAIGLAGGGAPTAAEAEAPATMVAMVDYDGAGAPESLLNETIVINGYAFPGPIPMEVNWNS